MKLIEFSIDELKPAEYNPRVEVKEGSRLYDQIKDSLDTFGYVDPVIVNKDKTVIAGHQRLKVMKAEGYSTIEAIQIDIDKTKEKALNIALNKIDGMWDDNKLKVLFSNLTDLKFDLKLTGFNDTELKKFFTLNVSESNSTAIKNDLNVSTGSLYVINHKHLLLCGDSTNMEDVNRLIQNYKINMLLTDPPYGINYDEVIEDRKRIGKIPRSDRKISNDDLKDYYAFYYKFLSLIPFSDYNTCYVFMVGANLYNYVKAFTEIGGKYGSYLIWLKQKAHISRKDYCGKHEFIYYGWIEKHKFYGPVNACAVMEYPSSNKNVLRPHQKPLDLIAQLIDHGSKKEDIIYDPFGGSGTTLIAADKMGRKCLMMENDPGRINTILNRVVSEGGSYECC